jgi:hypothetical protein
MLRCQVRGALGPADMRGMSVAFCSIVASSRDLRPLGHYLTVIGGHLVTAIGLPLACQRPSRGSVERKKSVFGQEAYQKLHAVQHLLAPRQLGRNPPSSL